MDKFGSRRCQVNLLDLTVQWPKHDSFVIFGADAAEQPCYHYGMSTDEFLSLFGARKAHEPRDPMKSAQSGMRKALPRRFYTDVSLLVTDDGVALQLDGKTARTPARKPLVIANATIANALMHEWNAQLDIIDPAAMPLTRLINAALDGVARDVEAVRAEIVRYAASDLICYRADTPQELVALQSSAWDPLMEWAHGELDAPLKFGRGIIHVSQPKEVTDAITRAVAMIEAPLRLAALSTVTTLTGSTIIALALAHGRLSANETWLAAHVDEDYQARVWGADDEAAFRLANRRRDFDAAALVLDNTRQQSS
jgi:chaperone required for assembly of F1-ATPase